MNALVSIEGSVETLRSKLVPELAYDAIDSKSVVVEGKVTKEIGKLKRIAKEALTFGVRRFERDYIVEPLSASEQGLIVDYFNRFSVKDVRFNDAPGRYKIRPEKFEIMPSETRQKDMLLFKDASHSVPQTVYKLVKY